MLTFVLAVVCQNYTTVRPQTPSPSLIAPLRYQAGYGGHAARPRNTSLGFSVVKLQIMPSMKVDGVSVSQGFSVEGCRFIVPLMEAFWPLRAASVLLNSCAYYGIVV